MAYVITTFLLSPIYSWLLKPIADYILTPLLDFVLSPVWHFFVTVIFTTYEYLPSPSLAFLYSWMDMNTLEFFIHFLACVLTVGALVIVLFVYFCYVFTDRAKFGVVTRHPLKEGTAAASGENGSAAPGAACAPGCTQQHVHRRYVQACVVVLWLRLCSSDGNELCTC